MAGKVTIPRHEYDQLIGTIRDLRDQTQRMNRDMAALIWSVAPDTRQVFVSDSTYRFLDDDTLHGCVQVIEETHRGSTETGAVFRVEAKPLSN